MNTFGNPRNRVPVFPREVTETLGGLSTVFAGVTIFLLCCGGELAARQVTIDPLSGMSLFVTTLIRNERLTTATGFVVEDNGRSYLITNWHVLSGRDPSTGMPSDSSGRVPDRVCLSYRSAQPAPVEMWFQLCEMLYDSRGNKRWLEHIEGRNVDVVALPLHAAKGDTRPLTLDLSLADANVLQAVAMPVSIVGFPYGLSAGGMLPIWKTGQIASDPEVNYDDRPEFLVDARTRPGMSGSPVWIRQYGMHATSRGDTTMVGECARFLGVYSGHLEKDSDIGIVWRPSVIKEILARAK